MDATLKAAWQGAAPTIFTAVEIVLNGGDTIRLVDGGMITIDGDAYVSEDDTYGALGDVETISDGADGQASRCTIVINAPTTAAIQAFAAATAQGSSVNVYQGGVDRDTGASIGVAENLFRGELDFARLAIGADSQVLTIECGTEEGRLLEPNMERKLSDAFHQSVWPGELGEEFATGLTRKIYWRSTDPATTAIKGKGVSIFGQRAPS